MKIEPSEVTLATANRHPTRALAELVADTRGDAIPDAVLTCLEECLLDFAGNASFAAAFAESSPSFKAGARALDPDGGGTTVLGDRETWSLAQAALLNGAFAHTLDFDDTNGAAALHPGAPVIPLALGYAERVDTSGRVLLDAIVLGYEVMCRIGAASGITAYDRGFHLTGVAGIFGAVAAYARLKGLNADTVERAFGLAGSLASGSMQYIESGAWNKRLHPGFAAQSALQAVAFAEAGVLAAHEPLAGRYGLLNGYSNAPQATALTDGLGIRWAAAETGIKPYPSCRLNHSAIDAALVLRGARGDRRDARIAIRVSPKAFDIVGEPQPRKIAARSTVDGQFSIYFQVACAWLDGAVTWQSYERLGDADVDRVASRIAVTADPAIAPLGCRMTIDDATTHALDVLLPAGEPSTPLGRPRIKAKFLSLAGPVFGVERADAIADRLLAVRNEASTTELIRAMRRP